MSLWRQLARGLRSLTGGAAADRDVADEVRHFFDEARAALEAEGLSPEEAHRAARLALGSELAAREQVLASGWEQAVGTALADLRLAARRLRQSPGFTAVATLTLALGIGASTAIFSAVNPILFEPLPYPQAGRIVMIWDRYDDGVRADVTFHTGRELRARSRAFDAMAAVKPWQPTLTGPSRPERFDGQAVGADYFRVLGVAPARGRDFEAADDVPHAPRVAILADALWRRRFGGDPAVIGRPATLDDRPYTIIGVMPPSFENVLAPAAEIWSPLQYDATNIAQTDTREWGHHLRLVARLRSGAGVDAASRDLDAIARAAVPEFPRPRWAALDRGLLVNPLQEDVTRGVKPALLAVLGAVLLVLAIACVNVTNLLLARGAARRGELAMRTALGAGRARLIRQLLTESLLLALIGGALGVAFAAAGVRALVALAPPGLPRVGAIAVDGTVLAFALALTAVTGLLAGLVPALQAPHGDLPIDLQRASQRATGSHQRTRRLLVVAEVALALVLLAGAGLLLRSVQRLFAVSTGFDASHVLTMQVQSSGQRFDADDVRRRFFERALEAVRRVPGVASAGFTSLLPLSGDRFGTYGVAFEGDEPGRAVEAYRYVVSPGYVETMAIPLRRGRLLDAHDTADAPYAALISASLAARKFPGAGPGRGEDPLGKRLHIGPTDRPWYTIVGIVGDVKQASLAASEPDAVYITSAQSWFADDAMSLVARANGDAAALAPAVREAIWSVDKDQPIVRVGTMEGLLAASAAERRFAAVLFEAFGLTALLLAATGIYGVLAGSVAERTREIGVRAALGASRARLLALVAGQGLALTAAGIALGLLAAAAATRALATLLFGISPLDPLTHAAVVALLAAASAVACAVPAWRAARVDPSITLREG